MWEHSLTGGPPGKPPALGANCCGTWNGPTTVSNWWCGHLNRNLVLISNFHSRLVNRLIDRASESHGGILLFTIWELRPAARCRSLAGLRLPLLLPHPAT